MSSAEGLKGRSIFSPFQIVKIMKIVASHSSAMNYDNVELIPSDLLDREWHYQELAQPGVPLPYLRAT